jgi:hypothetical protein
MPDSITPPPHLLKKFSTEARDESNKRNGTGYLKTFAKLCIEWANSKSTSNDRQIRSSEITPPPELVQQLRLSSGTWLDQITNAYQAGADQAPEANSKPTPNDRQIRSSLVERVHSCIVGEPPVGHMQARAAIREVAAWLRTGTDLDHGPTAARFLTEEAGPTLSQEDYDRG